MRQAGSTTTRAGVGFTLIEVVVALVLVGLVVLIGAALVAQEQRIKRRLEAQASALRSVEATIEGIRAGVVAVENQRLAPPWPPPRSSGVTDMTIVIRVAPDELPGLTHLAVEAQYRQAGRVERREVETLYWAEVP